MKNSRTSLGVFIAASLTQLVAMKNLYGESLQALPFATTYEPQVHITALIARVFCIYIPVPFMFFFIKETELNKGYEKVLMIRKGSREQMLIRKVSREMLIVIGMVIFLTALYGLLGRSTKASLALNQIAEILLIYGLTIADSILLGHLLECVAGLRREVVDITVNVFFVFSLLLPKIQSNLIIKCIFFPGTAFIKTGEIYKGICNDTYLIATMMLAGGLLMFLICIMKYRKIDFL